MHYSDWGNLGLPDTRAMTATEGLLDRSVEAHQSLHGIPLTGNDHIWFSLWNYPDNREERPELEQECPGLTEGEEPSSSRHAATLDNLDELDDERQTVPAELSTGNPRCLVCPCPREEMATVNTFNNLAGTLTDGPRAFPYSFSVHMGHDLKFDDLVNYCLTRTSTEPLRTLPARETWGSVNPVLLMEDRVNPATGNTVHRYTVTSRGHLSTIVANRDATRSLCYNEVFLPGRPVSRLNLDVDLKCCRKCNERFATHAERSVKHKVSEALTTSLISVIVESLFRLAKVKRTEWEHDPCLRKLASAVGKIAVYVRASSAKSKLSLRMLWYLPVELCAFEGIEAYRPLLDEMENVSLNYVLLSYPQDAGLCGLCDLGNAMVRGGCNSSGSSYLRLDSNHATNRRSSIDKAPYSFRKCVRLPNCYKEDSGFEYVDTFNTQDLEDPGCDDPLSLSVGLSSNPILNDVTSLGNRFQGLLRALGHTQPLVVSGLAEVPDQAHVESEARRLALLWGVPVTIRKTGTGLFCVQANGKSATYPCPIHNRVHARATLGAVVFATHTKPKCFVP